MKKLGLCVWVLALGGLGAACGEVVEDDPPPFDVDEAPLPDRFESATYIGFVNGSDAVMALTVDGDEAFGYTCGGGTSLESHTMWFGGDAFTFGEGRVFIDCGDSSINATIAADGTVSGIATILGEDSEFFATRTVEGTMAGLYKDADPDCSTGAVVFQESPEVEPFVQGAWCNGGGAFAQVTPMSPVQLTADGLPVEIPISEDHMTQRYLPPFSL